MTKDLFMERVLTEDSLNKDFRSKIFAYDTCPTCLIPLEGNFCPTCRHQALIPVNPYLEENRALLRQNQTTTIKGNLERGGREALDWTKQGLKDSAEKLKHWWKSSQEARASQATAPAVSPADSEATASPSPVPTKDHLTTASPAQPANQPSVPVDSPSQQVQTSPDGHVTVNINQGQSVQASQFKYQKSGSTHFINILIYLFNFVPLGIIGGYLSSTLFYYGFDDAGAGTIGIVVLALFLNWIVLLPVLISNTGRKIIIWILLILFGWTVIGWFILLLWALNGNEKDRREQEQLHLMRHLANK